MSKESLVLFNQLKEKNRKNLHESEDYIFANDSFLRDSQVASQPEMRSLIVKSEQFN